MTIARTPPSLGDDESREPQGGRASLKVSQKIVFSFLIPILALLYFSSSLISTERRTSADMSDFQQISTVIVRIGAMVHETQKERGATGVFVGSGGKKFRVELDAQRLVADKTIAAFFDSLAALGKGERQEKLRQLLEPGLQHLRQHATHRIQVDNLSIPVARGIGYFNEMHPKFLSVVSIMGQIVEEPSLIRTITTYVNFMQGKERSGVERATMAGVFAQDRFETPALYHKFSSLVAEQAVYERVFLSLGSAEALNFYKKTVPEAACVTEVQKMRTAAHDKATTGGFGVDAAYWYEQQTARINLMKKVEDFLANELSTSAAALQERAHSRLRTSVFLSVIPLVSSILLGLWLFRTITSPLANLQATMRSIQNSGNLSLRVDAQSRDEFGETARIINALLHDMHSMMKAINEVMSEASRGNLRHTVQVEAKGEFDLLKRSINRMIEDLQGMLKAIRDTMRLVSEGDLRSRIEVDAEGEFALLRDTINQSLKELSHVLQQMGGSVHQVATASAQANAAVGQIAEGVQQQFSSLRELAQHMEESNRAVQDISTLTQEASEQSKTLALQTVEGRQKGEVLLQAMTLILENSEKVNEIASVISQISQQTKMLSLNAALEAAHAGQHGKGFAVVADQVGRFAENTASSTREISTSLSHAATETQRGATVAQDVNQRMAAIARMVAGNDGLLGRIAVALEQQRSSFSETSATVGSLSKIGENNASATHDLEGKMEELARIAAETRKNLERFKTS